MDTIDFNTFNEAGVSGSDTFETWRQKTNGIIEEINTINSVSANYVTGDMVLLLNSTPQTVSGNTSFSGGINVGGNGNLIPLTANASNELLLTNNLVVDGKNVTANSLILTSPTLTIGGEEYTWPTGVNAGDGYLYHNNAEEKKIEFKSTQAVVAEVLSAVGEQGITVTQELTPVGTIVRVHQQLASEDEGLWLNCDGDTFDEEDYPELYAVLGDDNTLPILNTLSEFYIIKALPENVATFAITVGAGLSTTAAGSIIKFGASTISFNGNTDEFNISSGAPVSLKNNGIDYTKLKDASAQSETGKISIPLRDSFGYIRGETPTSNDEAYAKVLVNKQYVDLSTTSKDHKIFGLNGRGFNSYGVQAPFGAVFVDYEGYAKVFGVSSTTKRFGDTWLTNAVGHSLPPYSSATSKVYTDHSNTYLLKSNGKVWSYGNNISRKTGNNSPSLTSAYVSVPCEAFGGVAMSEVILSYDTNAETMYALSTSGELYVAGRNDYGQLGLGLSSNNSTGSILPQKSNVRGLTISKAWIIGGGITQTGYALATDGTLWACGYGAFGQMGRAHTVQANRNWVPVLNNTAEAYVGGTTTFADRVYTSTSNHGLQNYDVIIVGANRYVVEVTAVNKFKLYTADDMSVAANSVSVSNSSSTVNKRLSGISDAYFGGTLGNTFGFIKMSDGSLRSWGYNGKGQLGLNSLINATIPTPVPITSGQIKASDLYTGLDDTVHFKGTGGLLYACGDNTNGELGIGKIGGYETTFKVIAPEHLNQSGLTVVDNQYSVYKFFSSGTRSRFCIFESGGVKKLTAWGSDLNGKLGVERRATSYNRPQNVYISNEENISDIQTCNIANSLTDFTTILIKDSGANYGDVFACGYNYYSINNGPDGTVIPFFTKVKNI